MLNYRRTYRYRNDYNDNRRNRFEDQLSKVNFENHEQLDWENPEENNQVEHRVGWNSSGSRNRDFSQQRNRYRSRSRSQSNVRNRNVNKQQTEDIDLINVVESIRMAMLEVKVSLENINERLLILENGGKPDSSKLTVNSNPVLKD